MFSCFAGLEEQKTSLFTALYKKIFLFKNISGLHIINHILWGFLRGHGAKNVDAAQITLDCTTIICVEPTLFAISSFCS